MTRPRRQAAARAVAAAAVPRAAGSHLVRGRPAPAGRDRAQPGDLRVLPGGRPRGRRLRVAHPRRTAAPAVARRHRRVARVALSRPDRLCGHRRGADRPHGAGSRQEADRPARAGPRRRLARRRRGRPVARRAQRDRAELRHLSDPGPARVRPAVRRHVADGCAGASSRQRAVDDQQPGRRLGTAGRDDPARRVPPAVAAQLEGRGRRAGVPELREAGGAQSLVPQRHGGQRLHAVRRAGCAVGAVPRRPSSPRRTCSTPTTSSRCSRPTTGSAHSRRSPSSATPPCATRPTSRAGATAG